MFDTLINYYLISPNGRCILSYDDKSIEKDLLSGLIVAMTDMASMIGFEDITGFNLTYLSNNNFNLKLIKSNEKFFTGFSKKSVYGLLSFKKPDYFDKYCDEELSVLNKELTNYFVNNYKENIKSFVRNGDINNVNGLGKVVEKQMILFKEHIHASYLINILSESSMFVKKKISISLINDINNMFSSEKDIYKIKDKLSEYSSSIKELSCMPHSKVFNNIIKKVNKRRNNVWRLFKIPLIEVDYDSC